MRRLVLLATLVSTLGWMACDDAEPATTDTAGTDAGDTSTPDTASDTVLDTVPDAVPDTGGETTSTTANVLCSFTGSGDQNLVYTLGGGPNPNQTAIDEVLAYNFTWACNGTDRTLSGNGVPNHAVTGGVFASQLTAQTISQTFPLEPVLAAQVTQVKEPGYALNSVKFDPATAGTCPDNAVDDSDCNYAMGSDTWGMVATAGDTSPWKFGFGVDENDAHVQPNGQYHYHGIPVNLVAKLNPSNATSMTLVGWAADGFPMYSVEGHADANDLTSAVADMKSSFQTVGTPAANRPSVADFPLGHFTQDWEYVAGSGDLDECNGRFGATPEFPQGIYHYHLTRTYPFVQRCVKGDGVVGGGGPPGGGPPAQ